MTDPPRNKKKLPRFAIVVDLLEKLSSTSGRGSTLIRRELISEFISQWRQRVGDDIYPAFRLILPHLDSEGGRISYFVKEKVLAKVLAAALGLSSGSKDAKQLMAFKQAPGVHSGDDFADVACAIIEKRNAKHNYSDTSLEKILQVTHELSQAKHDQRVVILRKVLDLTSSVEMKWFLRIILKSVGIHTSEKTILGCLHPDANALFNVTNDLKRVCHTLYDPSVRLGEEASNIKPMNCFRPHKALFTKHVMEHFEDLAQKLPQTFYIEEKLDGERIQLHWTDYGNSVRYFSRKGKEYTSHYGPSVNKTEIESSEKDWADSEENEEKEPRKRNYTLTPLLSGIINDKVESCVLDGEVVPWHILNQEICPSNFVRTAAKFKDQNSMRPFFLVFDILHLNGKDLSDYSLKNRKQALEKVIVHPQPGILEAVPYIEASSAADIEREFQNAIRYAAEGLIIKNPETVYCIDGKNESWIKIKPEYMAGYQNENFDLAVVGAFLGKGSRAKLKASFLVAIRSGNGKFMDICKVGNGFCMAAYQKIDDLTKDQWVKFDSSRVPKWLLMGTEKPDYIIEDISKALVFEVKATQITRSTNYRAGWSLRFPRFVDLRTDKGVEDVLSADEFEQLRLGSNIGTPKRKNPESSRKQNDAKRSKFNIINAPVLNFDRMSGIFDSGVFIVAGDAHEPKYMSQVELETLIKANGGKVERYGKASGILIADDDVPLVVARLKSGQGDVIRPRWVLDCINNKKWLPLEPRHYLHASPESLAKAERSLDEYGLALARQPSISDVEAAFAKMNVTPVVSDAEMEAVLTMLLSCEGQSDGFDTRGLLFAGLILFIDDAGIDGSAGRLSRLVRFGFGTVSRDCNDPRLTHFVSDDKAGCSAFRNKKRYPAIHTVSSEWVLASWREGTRQEERFY